MSAPRPAQDQVPTPPTAATAASEAGGVSGGDRGLRPLPPTRRQIRSRAGRTWCLYLAEQRPARPQGADTSSRKNAAPGQEAGEGCGEAGPQAGSRRSVLKGTRMPGAGEGLESVAGALEELGVSPGEELSSSPKREKRHLALPTPRLKIWL